MAHIDDAENYYNSGSSGKKGKQVRAEQIFNEKVKNLQELFENIDRNTLAKLLKENKGGVEQTADYIVKHMLNDEETVEITQ